MKNRISLSELGKYVGEEVNLSGFVDSVREQKRMQFVILRDRSDVIQVANERRGDELESTISSLTPESTVSVRGKLVRDEHIKLRQMEIKPYEIKVTSCAQTPLPILENAPLDKRLDWRHIDLRKPKNRLIFDIQTIAENAMRKYWLDHDFIEIHSPKLVGGATESGAELFQLDYFGKKASLAQSPQFYKQMAMAAGFERVFEIGPVFRANPSYTSRHDTEFTSVDVEMSWINSHEDIMEFEEHWLQHVLGEIKMKRGEEIKGYFGAEIKVPEMPFPRVSMKEAYDILGKMRHIPEGKQGDLDSKGEKLLSKYIQDTYGHEFAFVKDYPANIRPFYHMRHDDKPDITKSFDLIWKGVEVTTGAQREHRHDVLLKQAIEKGMDPSSIENYLNFFKYGCPPHGGYGFGLTRMLMMMLDIPNVREVTYLYRGPNRLAP